MPVGNDVVDLRDPANRPDALHPGFDRRVFSDADLRRLAACDDDDARHSLRWCLWAVRESAYKFLRQVDANAGFRPRAVDVRLETPPAGRVETRLTWGDTELSASVDADQQRVHAVVRAPGREPPLEAVRDGGDVLSPRQASSAVRTLAAGAVARLLGLSSSEVRVLSAAGPGDLRVPTAIRDDRRLPVDVSLSHDGRWLACAVSRAGPSTGSS